MREGAAEARARKVDLMLSPLSVSRDLSRGAMRVDEVQERRTPSQLPSPRLVLGSPSSQHQSRQTPSWIAHSVRIASRRSY